MLRMPTDGMPPSGMPPRGTPRGASRGMARGLPGMGTTGVGTTGVGPAAALNPAAGKGSDAFAPSNFGRGWQMGRTQATRAEAMGAVPPGLDPQAIAADPQGFQRWMQGYQQRQQSQEGQPGGFSVYGGGMVNAPATSLGVENQNVEGTMMNRASGDSPPLTGSSPWSMTRIDPNNSLINQQILPGDSDSTGTAQGWTRGAGDAYNDFRFNQFQGLTPLNFGLNNPSSRDRAANASTPRGGLSDALERMQGLGYDWRGVNDRYDAAGTALGDARTRAQGDYAGLQGLGVGSFSGGGANLADFSRAEAMTTGAVGGDLGKSFDYGSDVGRARGLALQQLERAMNAPDRKQIGAETLALLEERSQPGYEQTLRQVNARNAAMGRRGSGITTNELGDVTLARERELGLARRDLANEAAARTLQDNIDRTNLAMGVTTGLGAEDRGKFGVRQGAASLELQAANQLSGNAQFNAAQGEAASQRAARGAQFGADFQRGLARDLYDMGRDRANFEMRRGDVLSDQQERGVRLGQDQAGFTRNIALDRAGLLRDEYGAARDERDTARRDQYDQFGVNRTRFNDFRSFLGDERANDFNRRQEARGERAFQYGQSRDAVADELQRFLMEEQLRNNRYNRALGYTGLGFGGNNVAEAYQGQAGFYGNNANDWYSLAGQLAQLMGQQGGPGRRPPTTTTTK